jgi:uncharacterized glyoxalase superfamily protein PhnB
MFSQQEEWSVLAKKDVAFKAEQDVITLRGADKDIKKFKIKCTQGSLKLKGVTIIYKDDTRDEKKPKGTGLLTKGTSSLTFGVDKDKVARKIELSYGAIGNMLLTKRAKIEVLGK